MFFCFSHVLIVDSPVRAQNSQLTTEVIASRWQRGTHYSTMASREDRAVLKGLGEMLMDRVSKHATGRQWNEWLKVPLEVALRLGDSELASRLLVAGSVARVGSSSKETHPLLLTAFAERGQDKQEPCASRAGVDFTSPGAFTAALHEAVEYGKLGDVQALFEAGAKPGNRQEKGLLLHSAIRRGDADIVSELLGRGADADIPDLDGRSPLRSAVSTCSWPIVTVLLERGAGASATMLGEQTSIDPCCTDGGSTAVTVLSPQKLAGNGVPSVTAARSAGSLGPKSGERASTRSKTANTNFSLLGPVFQVLSLRYALKYL